MKADSQLLLVAGGAGAIVLALLWRYIARRHQVSRLNRAVRFDDNPAERARAGNALVELGLPRASKPILRAVDQESDDRVRLSIALAVARRQWEPARAKRVADLRKWAGQELEFQGHPVREFGPAVTRLADMGGPRVAPWGGNADRVNGNGAAAEQPDAAPVATLPAEPTLPESGNGNGAAPPDVAPSVVTYRPAEHTPSPAPDPGIRWVAPDVGDRTDS